MAALRYSSPGLGRAAFVWLAAGLFWLMGPADGAASSQRHADPGFQRADVATIRAHTRDILSDPRFAPRKSFAQWLLEKLQRLQGRDRAEQGWTRVLWWLVLIWGVLTILAILAHIIWTLCRLLGIAVGGKGAVRAPRAGIGGVEAESYDKLRERMRLLATHGRFREAVGLMMLALVRWLDAASIVSFHHSKTNGDYVREYPVGRLSRDSFRRFVLAFDERIYGGARCDQAAYTRMNTMFGRVISRVRQES